MLGEQTEMKKCGLDILGYCLMSNYVLLLVVPSTEEALAQAVGRAHFRYTQYINRFHHRSGHLWHGREWQQIRWQQDCFREKPRVRRFRLAHRWCVMGGFARAVLGKRQEPDDGYGGGWGGRELGNGGSGKKLRCAGAFRGVWGAVVEARGESLFGRGEDRVALGQGRGLLQEWTPGRKILMTDARSAASETTDKVKQRGEQIATGAKFSWLARFGYAARGFVYLIVGGLAVLAAVGQGGGQTTGSKGALRSLVDEPYGQALLVVVGVGLLAFGVWRAVQAFADADGHGTGGKGMAIRAGMAVSAVMHGFLAAYAVSIAFGWGFGGSSGGASGGSGGSSSEQSWSAWLLGQPGGGWLLGIVGLILIAVGVAQVVKGWKEKYQKYLAMDWRKQKWADPVCKFGLIARGAVFGILGAFVGIAAYQTDPSEVRGLGGALRSIQGQAYGTILLLIVALGLLAFGLYSIIEAVYRRIEESGQSG